MTLVIFHVVNGDKQKPDDGSVRKKRSGVVGVSEIMATDRVGSIIIYIKLPERLVSFYKLSRTNTAFYKSSKVLFCFRKTLAKPRHPRQLEAVNVREGERKKKNSTNQQRIPEECRHTDKSVLC